MKLSIEQYIEYYNNEDWINKIAILILDIDTILQRKYEDMLIPYLWCGVNGYPKIEDWITEYLQQSTMSYIHDSRLKSMEYDYQMDFKSFEDSNIQLRVMVGNMDHRYHELHEISQQVIRNIDSVEQVDLYQALRKMYVADLYYINEDQKTEYKELKKNLEFMKSFIRECFTK